jgi:hypothetical protein
MLNKFTINWFYPIFVIVGIILCSIGKVSWAVFGLILLSQLKITTTWEN